MSTPAGQSAEQPLQDRQRSSTSRTSSARKLLTNEPLASSCRTRARPRVESFSSFVARNDGPFTARRGGGRRRAPPPPVGGGVPPTLADAHAAVDGGRQVTTVLRVGEAEVLAQWL